MRKPTYAIRELKQLVPNRPVTLADGRAMAERQAALLLALTEPTQPGADLRTLARALGVEVTVAADLAVSAMSEFICGRWHIILRGSDDVTQRRLSLAHEFWVVIMDGRDDLFSAVDAAQVQQWTQECADHFATTLLMPKTWIYSAWAQGMRDVQYLAARFVVTRTAMRHRLREIGLLPQRRARTSGSTKDLLIEGAAL